MGSTQSGRLSREIRQKKRSLKVMKQRTSKVSQPSQQQVDDVVPVVQVEEAQPMLRLSKRKSARPCRPRRECVSSVQEGRPLAEREEEQTLELLKSVLEEFKDDEGRRRRECQHRADRVEHLIWTYELELANFVESHVEQSDEDLAILVDYIIQVVTGHVAAQRHLLEELEFDFLKMSLGQSFERWLEFGSSRSDPHFGEILRTFGHHSVPCLCFLILKGSLIAASHLKNHGLELAIRVFRREISRGEFGEALGNVLKRTELEPFLAHKGCPGLLVEDLEEDSRYLFDDNNNDEEMD